MSESGKIQFLVIIGIAVMLFLFASFLLAFVFNQRKKLQYNRDMQVLKEKQQNQLLEAAIRSEETERHRIAETLHDEVGAILSSAKMHIENIKTLSLDKRDKELHDKGKELLDEGISKVRDISHNLHSNILKEFGLNEAIRHFIFKITKGTIINAQTALDNSYTTQNAENDISIYRMVQELINNILKHSQAKKIMITSAFDQSILHLLIQHDGAGLNQAQFEELRFKKDGMGLKNIQNRLVLLRGKIEFSVTDEGNQVKILIPYVTS